MARGGHGVVHLIPRHSEVLLQCGHDRLTCALVILICALLLPLQVSAGGGSDMSPASRDGAECVPVEPSVSPEDYDFLAERHPAGLANGARISAIRFYRQNVFPDADHLLAQLANRLNVLTQPSTLLAALPFAAGDTVTDEQLEEAERIMRQQRYLYDARVLVESRCADGIELLVIVRDVWTLAPNAGFSRSGGDNSTQIGITESNLFGWGKALSLGYESDLDRSGITFSYFDPNVLGSRWTTAVTAANNDDGDVLGFNVERPFYALDATWAAGVSLTSVQRDQPLEYLSESIYDVKTDNQRAEIYFGRSRGRVGSWVDRYSVGIAMLKETSRFPDAFPGALDVERRFAYPFLRWQRIEDAFVTGADLDRVDRTEDLNLGLRLTAQVGISSDSFGGRGGNTVLYSGSLSKRWYLTQAQLFGVAAAIDGRYALQGDEGTADLSATSTVDYLWRHAPDFSFYARLQGAVTRNLDPESQLTLGGDTGLRGYPSRYQLGDRSVLMTLEERYYSDWFPFGLFRVGAACFVDIGRAWFESSAPTWVPNAAGDHFGTLSNVGVGLRLESVRTRRDRVLHIDLAHPLVEGPGVDSWQITLSAKRSL